MNLRLVKNINYMVLAQAANYMMPLILIPYLVRTLGLAAFGDFSVSQSVISIGIIVVQFGFNIYVTKDIAERKKHGQAIDEIISVTFVLQIALATMLILIISGAYAVMPTRSLELSFWYSFAWLGQALFPVWYFQGSQYFKQLALLNFMLRGSTFILVLVYITREEDLIALPIIYSFSYLNVGLLACAIMWRRHVLCIPTVKELMGLMNGTKDVFFSNIASVSLMNMPIFFLSHQVSKEEVGAFSAILRVIYAIKGMLNSGFQVLVPTLISEVGRLNHKKLALQILLLLLMIVAATLAAKEPLLNLLYGRRTALSYNLEFTILLLSVIPGSLGTLYILVFATYYGEFVRRKQVFLMVCIVAALLYFPFIHLLNSLGAALVILICEIVLLILGIKIVLGNQRSREAFQ